MTGAAADRTAAMPTHDLLLALAGRIDDDLLAWARELAAVGEDSRAVDLLTATLIADHVPLPARVRAALVEAGRAARTELDVELALPPAREGEVATPHRFDSALPGTGTSRITAALHDLRTRQVIEGRMWLTWRLTPAGSAPGPLPHAVVLVELAGDVGADVLAYQFAAALERTGAAASVEVFAAGAELPEYHRAALRAARPIGPAVELRDAASAGTATEPPTPEGAGPSAPVPTTAGPRHAPAGQSDPADRVFPANAPQPAPTLASAASPVPAATVTPIARPPRQGPLVRHTGPLPAVHPLASAGEATAELPQRPNSSPAGRAPVPGPAEVAAHTAADPLNGPLREPLLAPLLDPTIDENDPLGLGDLFGSDSDPGPRNGDWISGSWAVPVTGSFGQAPLEGPRTPFPGGLPVADRPDPGPLNGERLPRQDAMPRHRSAPEVEPDLPASDPATEPAIDAAGLGLRSESLARLNATDHALLARLQAELGSRSRRPGARRRADTPANGTNGAAPALRPDPPDMAG